MVNNPRSVRNAPEKIWVLEFDDLMPPTMVTRQLADVEAFRRDEDLRLPADDPFGVDLNGIHLQVRAGEVVGIAGVSGNGQNELLAACRG